MYTPIPNATTCATGWLTAAQTLVAAGYEAYNVIVDIDDPVRHTSEDRAMIMTVDAFLRERCAYPIATVANTIFPQDLYRRYGPDHFRAEYLRGFDSLRKRGWGRYFERLTRWRTEDGRTLDQLNGLIAALSGQLERNTRRFKSIYEVTLVDPSRDKFRERNRQCLSFLSFKLHPDRGLTLTAIYRNHHYVARALGNFIGLGNLMAYVAKQVGTTVGPLTCISTHAELDVASVQTASDEQAKAGSSWGLRDVRELVANAAAARNLTNSATEVV